MKWLNISWGFIKQNVKTKELMQDKQRGQVFRHNGHQKKNLEKPSNDDQSSLNCYFIDETWL